MLVPTCLLALPIDLAQPIAIAISQHGLAGCLVSYVFLERTNGAIFVVIEGQ